MNDSRHLKASVTVETVGKVDISTIDLSTHGVRWLNGYETCLFWGGNSRVVDIYLTWDDAVEGHAEWQSAEKVARAIHVLYRDRINQ